MTNSIVETKEKEAKQMFQVRNEDGQVVSSHKTNDEAQAAARRYRRDREMSWSGYEVFGPVADASRQ